MERARPSKPAEIIKMEGKSHRTKKELRQREQAEESLLTGETIKESPEVRVNEKAHKEYLRIRKLLKSIGKADDLYGNEINRYCLLVAECADFEEKREQMQEMINDLEEHAHEMEYADLVKMRLALSKQLIAYDRQIQTKRKMIFDLEKENVMTIASSLRSIPKKPEKKSNPLKEALNG